MSGGIIKNIILAILLLWISFLVGSEAASDVESAGMIIAGIVALFVFIILGHNCWWLLFILPPVIGLIPLGVIQRLPLQHSIAAIILIYWFLMKLIGRSKFTWRSLPWYDYSLLVALVYIAISYYRHPVAIEAFAADDTQIVGGKDYIQILMVSIYFIVLSVIPFNWEQLKKVLRWVVWVSVIVNIVSAMMIGVTGGGVENGGEEGLAEAMVTSRFSSFAPLGQCLSCLVLSIAPLNKIICSPVKLGTFIVGIGGVMISGFRSWIAPIAFYAIWVSAIYRKILLCMFLALGSYATLLYLSAEDLLEDLPFGVQRVLSAVPGMNVSSEAKQAAKETVDWRQTMWQWAWDPRTKYIKDYCFGDGFGHDRMSLKRRAISIARGRITGADQETYAEHNSWHNFYLENIKTLGFVGLILVICLMLEALVLAFYTEVKLFRDPIIIYVMYALSSLVIEEFRILTTTGFTGHTLQCAIGGGALAKVIYIEARKAGVIAPFHWRKRYVPMAVRQLEQSQSQAGVMPM